MKEVPGAATKGLAQQFQEAVRLHQQGRLDSAQRQYRKILAVQPKHFDARHLLGLVRLHQGFPADAAKEITAALDINPSFPFAWVNLAASFEHLGNADGALASYDRAIAIKPDYAEAFNDRGRLLRGLRRLNEALASFDRAIALQPNFAMAYNNRGNVLVDLKRLDEALASYDRAIAIKPDYAQAFNNRGNVLRDFKRPAEALASCDRAIALQPNFAMAYNNRGNALVDLKRFDEALASYSKAIALRPDYAEAFNNHGNALSDLARPDQALASYDRAIAIRPDYAEAFNNRGNALRNLRRPEEALVSVDKAIAIVPGFAMAFNNRGNALVDLKRFDEALASYEKAIALKPDYAEAFNNHGRALVDLKRLEQALASCDRAIALKPDYAEAFNNRGIALAHLERLDKALSSYEKAIALKPDYAEAFNNRGNALRDLKRLEEALASYDRAIAIKPDYADAYNNRGNTLTDLKRPEEGLASYGRAIALKPDLAMALNNRGNALVDLKRLEEAVASYDGAIVINPDYAEAFNNRGNALRGLKRFDEALASCDRAIALKPDFAAAFSNRGNTLVELSRLDEALASYDKALGIKPDHFNALVPYMCLADRMCLWSETGAARGDLIARCRTPAFDGDPFQFLSMCDDPPLHRYLAETYVRAKAPPPEPPKWRQHTPRERIRLGYLSADFRQHAVSSLIVEVFELHDRSHFEILGVSAGPNDGSEERRRLEAAFDVFVDVAAMTDAALARWIADAEIDILVDLGGHTLNGRLLALAHRPAPVQVSYLGYPGTTGAPFIDYAIVDAHVVPASEAHVYSEQLVYLPDCYQCNDRKREIADRTSSRAECGLPADGFVFCCFNNSYKLNAPVFDVWMRLLKAVPNSVLWLLADNIEARANLQHEAAARGVAPQRLVFAERVSSPEHLARHRLADLFIDTLPYNAHTTASDALWAGVPVLTCTGHSFAARVAGSLLQAIGLPELMTSSLSEYEALALRLATCPAELRALRDRLARNRSTHPLFDTPRSTRHLEAAYQEMWRIHCDGESAHSFVVMGQP
jgi:protein O-GlcNAc transferase